jgi:hypothetical protein
MKTADLLALADREAAILAESKTSEATAVILRALTERVRTLQQKLRDAGVQMPEDK